MCRDNGLREHKKPDQAVGSCTVPNPYIRRAVGEQFQIKPRLVTLTASVMVWALEVAAI